MNDTLGGRPVAVTYNPLCDSAVVFDRTLGGTALTFGITGLLYNPTLLMHDRRPGGKGESLFSQLLFRAVAGPAAAAGTNLEVLPSSLLTWQDWRSAHPRTTVLAPDPRLAAQYGRDPYSSYFGSDLLRYPVRPLPPSTMGAYKTPVVALQVDGVWHAYRVPTAAARAGPGTTPTVYSSLFAWYAFHGPQTVWHE